MKIEPTFCRTAILLCVATSTFVFSAYAAFGQQATFEIVSRRNMMVPMRDGVKLATDIHLPAKNGTAVEGRFPVVLSRTPYGKASSMAGCDQKIYVPLGYVVVRQDTRGRGGSEGIWHWMTDARQDGYDTIEWIAEQPWSNGKIGMVGCSYVGATQHLAAMGQPPHLATIMPADPSINHGIGALIYGGAFRLRVWDWIFDSAAKGSRQARDPALKAALEQHSRDRRHYLMNLPLRRGLTPLRIASEYEDMLLDMMEHRTNDEFWRFSNVVEYVDEHKDIPVFMIGGWYDLFSSSTTETYMALRRTTKGPVHLIMGPWIHHMQGRSHGQVVSRNRSRAQRRSQAVFSVRGRRNVFAQHPCMVEFLALAPGGPLPVLQAFSITGASSSAMVAWPLSFGCMPSRSRSSTDWPSMVS